MSRKLKKHKFLPSSAGLSEDDSHKRCSKGKKSAATVGASLFGNGGRRGKGADFLVFGSGGRRVGVTGFVKDLDKENFGFNRSKSEIISSIN